MMTACGSNATVWENPLNVLFHQLSYEIRLLLVSIDTTAQL